MLWNGSDLLFELGLHWLSLLHTTLERFDLLLVIENCEVEVSKVDCFLDLNGHLRW